MSSFTGRLMASILAVLGLVVVRPVLADALDGQFEVSSAFININSGVFLLNADVRYPINEEIRSALADGVTVDFELQVAVFRERRYWLDADVVDVTLRRQLTFHSVSGRYIVKEAGSDDQSSYPTVDAALAEIGKIEGWPILTQPQLNADGRYRVAVRAAVRRGKLNDALRAILFWTNDWQRSSDWYEWSLLR